MNATQRKGILLGILYLSFISLGLPDTILGVAWPEMRHTFDRSLESAGILLVLTTALSVCSSLASGYVTERWNTGLILCVCGVMTVCAMLGYGLATAWTCLLGFTLLFGIGQGAVDTAVNAYMARNYSSRHMNWVHACWGIGATAGPMIMTTMFTLNYSWRAGYLCIAAIQGVLSLIFLISLPLWKRAEAQENDQLSEMPADIRQNRPSILRVGPVAGMLFYFLYPGVEVVSGLWGASYLVEILHSPVSTASGTIALFWGALTAGRIGDGFIAGMFRNAAVIRMGCALAGIGACIAWFAASPYVFRIGMICVGFGLGPLYPSMMHDTPARVGNVLADRVIGLQVGASLAGAMMLPSLLGWIAGQTSLTIFCPALLFGIGLVLIAHEISYAWAKKRGP